MNTSIPALICLLLGFLVATFVPENPRIRRYFLAGTADKEDNTRFVIFQKIVIIFFYGFIPLCLILIAEGAPADSGLGFSKPGFTLVSGLSIGAILALVNFLNRRNPDNLAMYPVIRKKEWTLSLLWLSALSWVVYIFSYEFLFRGYLLFGMFQESGVWYAVVTNLVLYSLVHVPKGWKEAVGSIPLGFVLCIICLRAGNMFPAFIAHSCLALSNEWFALSAHPAINLVMKRRTEP